jgi:alpha-amylase
VQIFVDDWDTERNQGGSLTASDYVSGDTNDAVGTYRYDLGNIFMLAQPYGQMAQVQSGYRFTNDNQDMPSNSAFSDGVAQVPASRSQNFGWDFIHRWPDISNMVNFRKATWGLNEGNWTVGTNNQIAFSRGNVGFVALNNDTSVWNNTFQTSLPAGTYCNVVNGVLSGGTCTADTVAVNSSGQATLSIPANGGSVVPAVAIYTGEMQAQTVPATPTGLTGSASGTTVTLSWTADSGTTSYTVYRSTSSTSGFASIAAPTINSYKDSTVTAGTTYYYFITASNSAGTSGNSSTVAVSVSLYSSPWTNMYLRGTMNSWGTTAMALVANDTWQVTVALPASTSYSYKYDASGVWTTNENWGVGSSSGVAALNAGNISYTSGVAGNYVFQFNDSTLAYTVTALSASTPSTPTELTATASSSSAITLVWSPSIGAASYIVYRSTSSSGPFTTSVGTPTTNSFSDIGLTASTAYYYEVAAVNSAGNSANTATVSATTLPSSSCTTVSVTFTIANANTVEGQNLYVAGNQTALGNWTPASAFALTIQGSGANVPWAGTVQLPPSTAIQYKYIKYNPSTGAVVWEANQSTSSGNRQQTTAPCGSTSSFNDGNF